MRDGFVPRVNPRHYLGPGVYFWEDHAVIAYDYVSRGRFRREENACINVIGARIELGNCLDLDDSDDYDLVLHAQRTLAASSDREVSFEALVQCVVELGASEIDTVRAFKDVNFQQQNQTIGMPDEMRRRRCRMLCVRNLHLIRSTWREDVDGLRKTLGGLANEHEV